ncbi:hypothetical protein [Phormidium pseudopriestleyi]|nr:hypothetical protein [Phormidium pseudopriestleyi]
MALLQLLLNDDVMVSGYWGPQSSPRAIALGLESKNSDRPLGLRGDRCF